MSSEITIQLDNDLINDLSISAQKTGHTLSQEIQYRLMLMFSNNDVSREDKPISSKLRGIIHLPKDFDYKKELEMRNV